MTAPALSNFLTVLAVEIAGEVAAYKRSSTAAHVAYLSAGRKLLDARENAPAVNGRHSWRRAAVSSLARPAT